VNIGIDSMVLIYAGVAPQAKSLTEPFKALQVRAKLLLHQLTIDIQAAAIAADIWERHRKLPKKQQYGKGKRHVLKADSMIVAAAKAAGGLGADA
jgi:hypothetical protein